MLTRVNILPSEASFRTGRVAKRCASLTGLVIGPPHGFGIGNPRKYVDVDPQLYPKEISQKKSRASRLPKIFIFFKKTTSVAGTFKKDQVQKFCSSQKLEHPQVENFESKKVGNFPKNPEIFSKQNQ